ncbi:MAG: PDZ domain-containing protein [Victivallales bacterium]|nr:PDZ domain-containing protein [Victivallales bacterium]
MRNIHKILLWAGLFTSISYAGEDADALTRLADKLSPSFVTVKWTGKADAKGENPMPTARFRCPACGRLEDRDANYNDGCTSDFPGVLVDFPGQGTVVLTNDTRLSPANIRSVEAVAGERHFSLAPHAWLPEQGLVLLKPVGSLPNLPVVSFGKADLGKKLYSFHCLVEPDGSHPCGVRKLDFSPSAIDMRTRNAYSKATPNTLVVDSEGRAVTFLTGGRLPASPSALSCPDGWRVLTREQFESRLSDLRKKVSSGVYAVTIHLEPDKRAMTEEAAKDAQKRYRRLTGTDNETEIDSVGLLLPDNRILVCRALIPEITARLHSVSILLHDGKRVKANFAGAFRYWGGFLAVPEEPLPGKPVEFSTTWPDTLVDTTVYCAGFLNYGSGLQTEMIPETAQKVEHDPLDRPVLHSLVLNSCEEGDALFDPNGRLLALRMLRLRDVKRHNLSSASLSGILKDANSIDPENIPRPEKERVFCVWLGVTAQGLNRELSRTAGVAELTVNGRRGVLVTEVAADSPAARAQIQPGDILLFVRLTASEIAMPLNGMMFRSPQMMDAPFPWARLSSIPERYFDELPTPWPPFETPFRDFLLTQGTGSKIGIGVIHEGKLTERVVTVEKAPLYYEAAPRFASKSLGATVADLTAEVREYFRMKASAPGVIVSKVTPGSPAATAGVRPYEIILSVNGQEVRSTTDFASAIAMRNSLELVVRRLNDDRVVKVTLSASR